MKIAVLTSSRADYGIYLPLLKRLKADPFFDLRLIAFGTHLSTTHGHTIDRIRDDGFVIDHAVEHSLNDDSPYGISKSMGTISLKFSEIWQKEKDTYHWVFCLGDRYEMFAAVSAATPFNIKFAHIHGGETTLGAIDNKFRPCLSAFSMLHFTATDEYARRVAAITGSEAGIYPVGALSLDNLEDMKLLLRGELFAKYGFDPAVPTILVTFHPETVAPEKNCKHACELVTALADFEEYQIVFTMPNADTMSSQMRTQYQQFAASRFGVFLVENFGTLDYFSCMQECEIIVGNSSSAIIEAASFRKYAVDIGDRQKGRMVSGNIIHSTIDSGTIATTCRQALAAGRYEGSNIYFKKGAAKAIVTVLKNEDDRPL